MIKTINISPINTTKEFYFDCGNCGAKNKVYYTNRIIHVDNKYDMEDLKGEPCPYCGTKLGDNFLPKLNLKVVKQIEEIVRKMPLIEE